MLPAARTGLGGGRVGKQGKGKEAGNTGREKILQGCGCALRSEGEEERSIPDWSRSQTTKKEKGK